MKANQGKCPSGLEEHHPKYIIQVYLFSVWIWMKIYAVCVYEYERIYGFSTLSQSWQTGIGQGNQGLVI